MIKSMVQVFTYMLPQMKNMKESGKMESDMVKEYFITNAGFMKEGS